jgi:hypothetical protein
MVKRRAVRKRPRLDAEIVFKTFVRALERLHERPRGDPSTLATIRETL